MDQSSASELKYYFGIDFGTTNVAAVCLVSMGEELHEIKFHDAEGRPFPAVVAIDKNTSKVYSGREAKDNYFELSKSCAYISSIKTILDDPDWELEILDKFWHPVDIAAEIFKSIKDYFGEQRKIELNRAVVSIPVGFNAQKRKVLREAAKLAGIHIGNLISEPTAAFFANKEALKGSSNIVIFDWGGGTLDVSVVQNENGKISELSSSGIDKAGDVIDDRTAREIHKKIIRKKDIKSSFEDMPSEARDILLVRSERAKRSLSEDDIATISINNYGIYGACRETLDYDFFSVIIDPIIEESINCLEKTIIESEIPIANIDRIVMVGGSSNLRPLYEKLVSKYGEKLYYPEETMWNVGQGAARLAKYSGDYYTNQTIGVLLSDGSTFPLLQPDTKLKNTEQTCHFGIVDTNEAARLIFTGTPDIDNSSDKFKVVTVPAYNFLEEQIVLTSRVDEDLVFVVKAKSNKRTDDYARYWEYTRLKCYFMLPGEGAKNE
jgi:molecular chaperone DnaK